jgi:hypothetical protein
VAVGCAAGHARGSGDRRACPACRRDQLVARVAAAEGSLPALVITAVVDAVITSPQALRDVSAALAADPRALAHGAPPVVGRLVAELIARGSATLAEPACVRCGRAGWPLTATGSGGMCARCRHRELAEECAACGKVRPVAWRDEAGRSRCETCRRHARGWRRCGACGKTASIAVRARAGLRDICVNCYQLPRADCTRCGRERPCNFAGDHPVCIACSPRAAAECAHCGKLRPPTARWPEGPVCDPCYNAALSSRGRCARCGEFRRLAAPPGPAADTCADCAGIPVTHACCDCGIEDKLYEKGRCSRCSLRRRARVLLSAGSGDIPAELTGVFEAIITAWQPRSALNWLRNGAGAGLLADVAAGRLAATHEALDAHPHQRAADYLRHMLTAGGMLPHRDEELARTEQWLATLLKGIGDPATRRLVQSFATWQVMRRLRRNAGQAGRPRSVTAHARNQITAAAGFLAWLDGRGRPLASCRHADIDDWLATGPGAWQVRGFLAWAARRGHCTAFTIPAPGRAHGPATSPDHRWALTSRLLHDDSLDPTDRVAGCLLLLYGQQLSRIAAITTGQVSRRDDAVFVRFGQHDVPVPEPLGAALLELIRNGRTHVGVGSPARTRWLFPGGLPGQPITASQLGERLRALGIYAMPGRRAALTDLAAQLPAAVLSDLLHLSAGAAVRWTHDAGGDWSTYAAAVAREHVHQA